MFAHFQYQRIHRLRRALRRLPALTDAVMHACSGWFADARSLSSAIAIWCWRAWAVFAARRAALMRASECASVGTRTHVRMHARMHAHQCPPRSGLGRRRRRLSIAASVQLCVSLHLSARILRRSYQHSRLPYRGACCMPHEYLACCMLPRAVDRPLRCTRRSATAAHAAGCGAQS